MKNKAITLIEIIAVIVVSMVAISTLFVMLADMGWRTGHSEAWVDSTLWTQELMEEIKSKDFQDPNQVPVFGPESGESTRSDFDDVDDFNEYSDTPNPSYNRTVKVDYVELSGTVWQAASSPPTNYKRVKVITTSKDGLVGEVSLVTIVANY